MVTYTPSEMAQVKLLENEVDKFLKSRQYNPKTAIGLNKALNMVVPNAMLPSKRVTIIWNSEARRPFIMSITPDINDLYNKSEELAKIMTNPRSNGAEFIKRWAEIPNWTLEIDTRVLSKTSRLCVDDAREFIALLYHEVGHVFTESPIRLISNFKLASLHFSMMEKMMLSNSKMIRCMLLPMLTHTLQFLVVVSNRNDAKACEIAADMYVPDEYKGALISYINNHLLTNPETTGLLMDEKTFDKEQGIGIELSRDCIEMLKGRRDVLTRSIQSQYNSPNASNFYKALMKFIGSNLLGYSPDTDTYTSLSMKSITENAYMREYIAQEKAARSAVMEASKITSRDLDVLQAQIEDISTHEDKMYFIHKVHDYIDAVTQEENKLLSKGKVPADILNRDDRLKRLSQMRSDILSKDVSSVDKFGLYIKYPAGYEG